MDWLLNKTVIAGCLAAIIALTGLTGYLGVQAYTLANEKSALTVKIATAETETARLKIEKGALDISVQTLKNEIDLAKQTQAQLSKAIDDLLLISKDAADKLKDVDNAPPTDDGPVAPVLRRTLDGLRQPQPVRQ